MDLIERQKAIDALADMHCKSDEDGYVWIIRSDAWARIDALPPAQPERKRGKWELIDDTEFRVPGYRCSACHCECEDWESKPTYNFCPNCGAKMEEDV